MSAERPRILFTDADDARVRAAVLAIADEGFARPLVLDPAAVPEREWLAAALAERRGLSQAAAARLLTRPTYLGLALLGAGRAAALVAGANSPTGDVLIACDMVLGRSPDASLTSSLFVLEVPGRAGRLVLADCAVNPSPDAEQLAAIAILAADGCRDLLGETPRVALLSFSSHGSATHPDAEKVARAAAIARAHRPDLAIDGELQADAALDADAASHKLTGAGEVAGRANVLVFPDLDAANIGYKLVRSLAGARALGVFLQGHGDKGQGQVVKLSRGATSEEIVGTCRLLAR